MLSCPIASWYLGQGVKLDPHRNIFGRSFEKFEELHLGPLERGVRHVVDERDVDALRRRLATVAEAGSGSARPAARNPILFHYQRHEIAPGPTRPSPRPPPLVL